MNDMKKSTYLVLVFASMLVALFVIEDAWGGVNEDGGVQGGEELIIPTLSRKLLAFGGYNGTYGGIGADYNNSTGSGLVPDSDSGTDLVSGVDPSFNFGSGSNMGSGSSMGSNTDLVPDSNPGFSFGSGSSMGSSSSTGSNSDLVPDTDPGTGSVSGSNPGLGFGSRWDAGSGSGSGMDKNFRIGSGGAECSEYDIEVDQAQTAPLPNGIPTYTVIITNTGNSGISNIHLSCGWFSSFKLVNPSVFQRLAYNDCLLINGGTLQPNDAVSFVYSDTFAYPLAVSSVKCN